MLSNSKNHLLASFIYLFFSQICSVKIWSLFILLSSNYDIINSDDDGRIQYHEQGYKGIESYRYGFQVDDDFNPQTKHEERDENGVVRGKYSYLEPSGNIREIQYLASADTGFRITGNISHEYSTPAPPPPPPPPPAASSSSESSESSSKSSSGEEGSQSSESVLDETKNNLVLHLSDLVGLNSNEIDLPKFAKKPKKSRKSDKTKKGNKLVKVAHERPTFTRVKISAPKKVIKESFSKRRQKKKMKMDDERKKKKISKQKDLLNQLLEKQGYHLGHKRGRKRHVFRPKIRSKFAYKRRKKLRRKKKQKLRLKNKSKTFKAIKSKRKRKLPHLENDYLPIEFLDNLSSELMIRKLFL